MDLFGANGKETGEGAGVLLVLSSPTGGGKTTIARRIVQETASASFSVSHTTRLARPGEADGVDYHFVDRQAFVAMRDAGEFAEWAEVHGFLYGTHREEIRRALDGGRDLVLDIDVQGGLQIKRSFAEAVLVFILPPSLPVLLARLSRRQGEKGFDLAKRMGSALKELDSAGEYEYIIVNEDLERAVFEARCVVEAARRRPHQTRARLEQLRADVKDWLGRCDVSSK